MNISAASLEIAVVLLGIVVLVLDLGTPAENKAKLGHLGAAGLGIILLSSFLIRVGGEPQSAFGGMFVQDPLALFFKRLFLIAAIMVLLMSVEYSQRIGAGISEYYALILFALSGMMFAASANDFVLLFVSLELMTLSFYILASFHRGALPSLEAGIKYLVLGALSSAFLLYGIAFVYGTAGTMNFNEIAAKAATPAPSSWMQLGVLLVLAGLGFKIAAVPYQMWAPDVYQGSPTPTTAFLAVGSKAAGFIMLLRVLFTAVPNFSSHLQKLLLVLAALSILYGNLCAMPQRNLKRMLAYSSIAHAGYLLLGIAAMSASGSAAILYYLLGYVFTVIAAFMVILLVAIQTGTDDLMGLSGLHRRSPFLAVTLSLAMVSLAGIPPMAGFFGKFLLFRAVIEQAPSYWPFYLVAAIAVVGVGISIYYYFGVIRMVYGAPSHQETSPIALSRVARSTLAVCVIGMIYLGTLPEGVLHLATAAVQALRY